LSGLPFLCGWGVCIRTGAGAPLAAKEQRQKKYRTSEKKGYEIMRIAILTGGGDVPGLNPAIKAVVRGAEAQGWDVVGFRKGWAGPLNVNPEDKAGADIWCMPLNGQVVRTIDRSGGTILHTSRTNPAKLSKKDAPFFLHNRFKGANEKVDCTDHVLRVLDKLRIDALVPIGGDDTLSFAARLHQEGFKVVSIPKTMDNDVFGTDYCLGFSTAVTRSVMCINGMRTSCGSHERLGVIEVFGRYSGETALISGYLADADRVLLAEVPFNVERLGDFLKADRALNGSHYAMLVVSEGATFEGGNMALSGEADAFGHQKLGGIGQQVGEALKKHTGIEVLVQSLGYIMRAGEPDPLDKMVALNFGTMAVQHLARGETGRMMSIQEGRYTTVESDMPIKGKRNVDVDAFYDKAAYKVRIDNLVGKPMFLY
jgi:6-phosphofructokinase 1